MESQEAVEQAESAEVGQEQEEEAAPRGKVMNVGGLFRILGRTEDNVDASLGNDITPVVEALARGFIRTNLRSREAYASQEDFISMYGGSPVKAAIFVSWLDRLCERYPPPEDLRDRFRKNIRTVAKMLTDRRSGSISVMKIRLFFGTLMQALDTEESQRQYQMVFLPTPDAAAARSAALDTGGTDVVDMRFAPDPTAPPPAPKPTLIGSLLGKGGAAGGDGGDEEEVVEEDTRAPLRQAVDEMASLTVDADIDALQERLDSVRTAIASYRGAVLSAAEFDTLVMRIIPLAAVPRLQRLRYKRAVHRVIKILQSSGGGMHGNTGMYGGDSIDDEYAQAAGISEGGISLNRVNVFVVMLGEALQYTHEEGQTENTGETGGGALASGPYNYEYESDDDGADDIVVVDGNSGSPSKSNLLSRISMGLVGKRKNEEASASGIANANGIESDGEEPSVPADPIAAAAAAVAAMPSVPDTTGGVSMDTLVQDLAMIFKTANVSEAEIHGIAEKTLSQSSTTVSASFFKRTILAACPAGHVPSKLRRTYRQLVGDVVARLEKKNYQTGKRTGTVPVMNARVLSTMLVEALPSAKRQPGMDSWQSWTTGDLMEQLALFALIAGRTVHEVEQSSELYVEQSPNMNAARLRSCLLDIVPQLAVPASLRAKLKRTVQETVARTLPSSQDLSMTAMRIRVMFTMLSESMQNALDGTLQLVPHEDIAKAFSDAMDERRREERRERRLEKLESKLARDQAREERELARQQQQMHQHEQQERWRHQSDPNNRGQPHHTRHAVRENAEGELTLQKQASLMFSSFLGALGLEDEDEKADGVGAAAAAGDADHDYPNQEGQWPQNDDGDVEAGGDSWQPNRRMSAMHGDTLDFRGWGQDHEDEYKEDNVDGSAERGFATGPRAPEDIEYSHEDYQAMMEELAHEDDGYGLDSDDGDDDSDVSTVIEGPPPTGIQACLAKVYKWWRTSTAATMLMEALRSPGQWFASARVGAQTGIVMEHLLTFLQLLGVLLWLDMDWPGTFRSCMKWTMFFSVRWNIFLPWDGLLRPPIEEVLRLAGKGDGGDGVDETIRFWVNLVSKFALVLCFALCWALPGVRDVWAELAMRSWDKGTASIAWSNPAWRVCAPWGPFLKCLPTRARFVVWWAVLTGGMVAGAVLLRDTTFYAVATVFTVLVLIQFLWMVYQRIVCATKRSEEQTNRMSCYVYALAWRLLYPLPVVVACQTALKDKPTIITLGAVLLAAFAAGPPLILWRMLSRLRLPPAPKWTAVQSEAGQAPELVDTTQWEEELDELAGKNEALAKLGHRPAQKALSGGSGDVETGAAESKDGGGDNAPPAETAEESAGGLFSWFSNFGGGGASDKADTAKSPSGVGEESNEADDPQQTPRHEHDVNDAGANFEAVDVPSTTATATQTKSQQPAQGENANARPALRELDARTAYLLAALSGAYEKQLAQYREQLDIRKELEEPLGYTLFQMVRHYRRDFWWFPVYTLVERCAFVLCIVCMRDEDMDNALIAFVAAGVIGLGLLLSLYYHPFIARGEFSFDVCWRMSLIMIACLAGAHRVLGRAFPHEFLDFMNFFFCGLVLFFFCGLTRPWDVAHVFSTMAQTRKFQDEYGGLDEAGMAGVNGEEIKNTYSFDVVSRGWTEEQCVWYIKAALAGDAYRALIPWLTKPRQVLLSDSSLEGRIVPELGQLYRLRSLDLSQNSLEGTIPSSLSQLSNLNELYLDGNRLTGFIPGGVLQLTASNLQILSLRNERNKRGGLFLPRDLGVYTDIRSLDLQEEAILGDVPKTISDLVKLEHLNLAGNSMRGRFPDLRGCSALKRVNLGGTRFTGAIPSGTLGILPQLEEFNIRRERVGKRADEDPTDGLQLPVDLGTVTQLEQLVLPDQTIVDRIPASIGGLHQLKILNLRQNHLTGVFPTDVRHCAALEEVFLDQNHLVGGVPPDVCEMRSLRILNMAQNELSDPLPEHWRGLDSFEELDLSNNHIQGCIPYQLFTLPKIKVLNLTGNNFGGYLDFNAEVVQHTKTRTPTLTLLRVGNNQLEGEIPADMCRMRNLLGLALNNNCITGELPNSLSKLVKLLVLDLSANQMTGPCMQTIVQMRSLQVVSLSQNAFTGGIPAGISQLSQLQVLRMHSNAFTGELPEELGELAKLQELDLSNNRFYGELTAPALSSLRKLVMLRAADNKFQGTIPEAIGSMLLLREFNVARNELTGFFPAAIRRLTELTTLDASGNHLEGHVPWSLLNGMRNLRNLSLGNNLFAGEIAPAISNLVALRHVDISGNYLTGGIPHSIARCSNLEQIILHHNKLQGPIPSGQLAMLHRLCVLDLSENKIKNVQALSTEIRNMLRKCIVKLDYK